MRIDDSTIERLIENVARLEKMLTNYENHVRETSTTKGENVQLAKQVAELKAQLASPEYRARVERSIELDQQEATLKAAKQLEYDKGYAKAYADVTRNMGKS